MAFCPNNLRTFLPIETHAGLFGSVRQLTTKISRSIQLSTIIQNSTHFLCEKEKRKKKKKKENKQEKKWQRKNKKRVNKENKRGRNFLEEA